MPGPFGLPAFQFADALAQTPLRQVELAAGGVHGPLQFALLPLDLDNLGQTLVPVRL